MEFIYNQRIEHALNYANNLKFQINYKTILNSSFDSIDEFNLLYEETLNHYIETEEYEICQKLVNKRKLLLFNNKEKLNE